MAVKTSKATREATAAEMVLVRKHRVLAAKIKALQAEADVHKDALVAMLGTEEVLTSKGVNVVSLSRAERKTATPEGLDRLLGIDPTLVKVTPYTRTTIR